jgi:hypothetical protein
VAVERAVVQALGLQEDDRVVVLDGRDQQALGVVGVARHHRAQAADLGEQRLRALAVRLPAVDAAAAGHADGERRGEVARRAVAQPRRLGDDLVRRRVEVVGKLDLHHRAQAVGAHAHGGADDAALGNRRVEHARLAVLGLQALGAAEHAAEVAHVLPKTTTLGSRSSITSMAERSAWIMVIGTVVLPWPPRLFLAPSWLKPPVLALPAQVLRHVLVHVLEHRRASAGMWPSSSVP